MELIVRDVPWNMLSLLSCILSPRESVRRLSTPIKAEDSEVFEVKTGHEWALPLNDLVMHLHCMPRLL